ncbi:MAG: SDR family oxidoreductase [Myxococcota bacterium]
MTTQGTVLITGCSTGIGRLAAETFHAKGWNVVATMRRPEMGKDLAERGLVVERLDVTEPDEITRALAATCERFGAIDVLVNNAGYGGHALLEQSSDRMIRDMYETNVFGVMKTCRAVLPIMRRQQGGRIINVTSMAGLMALPTDSVYTSTKYAVEGLTEGLALEVKPLGILAKTVAPGAYMTTAFGANNDNEDIEAGDPELAAYAAKLRAHLMSVVSSEGGATADPQEVADVIYRCATEDMPVHNPVGADAQMLMGLMGGAPRQDFIAQMEQMLLPNGGASA